MPRAACSPPARHWLARLAVVALLLEGAAYAAPLPTSDAQIPGAHDPALLSRYAGSRLVGYHARDYDAVDLAAGPYAYVNGGTGLQFARLLHVEGRLTRIAYNYAADRSALEVMRNYREALRAAGLKIVFSCDKDSCGPRGGEPFAREFLYKKLDAASIAFGSDSSARDPFGASEAHYLLASATRADGQPTYAAIYVVPPDSGNNGGVLVELVEPEAMESGKVTVDLDAEQMGKGLAADGKVALYGLYFDTDRSDVRADSKATLDEMAKLLRQDPKLTVYIVGHTDNQGAYAHNLELSQRRAEAVVAALVAGYQIDPKRLAAKGVASVAPVASNDTEAGRARNRRVELVKQ